MHYLFHMISGAQSNLLSTPEVKLDEAFGGDLIYAPADFSRVIRAALPSTFSLPEDTAPSPKSHICSLCFSVVQRVSAYCWLLERRTAMQSAPWPSFALMLPSFGRNLSWSKSQIRSLWALRRTGSVRQMLLVLWY